MRYACALFIQEYTHFGILQVFWGVMLVTLLFLAVKVNSTRVPEVCNLPTGFHRELVDLTAIHAGMCC